MSAGTGTFIPAAPGQFTCEWLSAALEPSLGQVHFSEIAVEPIGVGVGIMSLLFRLTPSYDSGSGPPSFVVKIAPPYEQVRQIAAGYRFYETEVAVYRSLGPELGLCPPTMYHAAHDVGSDEFVILMEDLSRLRQCDQVVGCPVADARLVIEALARHHAHWWQDERLTDPLIPKFNLPPYPSFNAQSGEQSWPVVLERFGDLMPERIRSIGSRWPEIGPPLLEDLPNHPLTLCHGDVRLDNMFFHDDEAGTVSIVDWAIVSAAGGVNDFGYFMSQSVSVEDRRAHGDELARLYYDTLLENGVGDYSFEDFWLGYRRTVLFCLCYPLQAGAVELVNDRAVALAKSMLERSVAAILDLDADEVAL